MKNIQHRLRRIVGQLQSADEAIEHKVACAQLIPQLMAVKGAVDSAVSAYIEQSLEECSDTANPEEAKKLVKMLIKNI